MKRRVEKLLGEIKESLKIAEEMVRLDLGEFLRDVRNRYTLRLALVEIVEASTALGLHILRSYFNVDRVDGYVQVIRKLVERGVISPDTGKGMESLLKLRDLIIHRYWEVDDERIYREAKGSV